MTDPAPVAARRVIVYHQTYGCPTGCCGHTIEVGRGPFETGLGDSETFDFDHYDERDRGNPTPLEWCQRLVAAELGEDHVADLDWDACLIEDHGGVVHQGANWSW